MNILIKIIIFAIVISIFAIIVVYFQHKPKTEMEIVQAKLKKTEKINKKNRKKINKSRGRLDSYTNNLIKKNGEMLKETQDKKN